ncbi:MAG: AbrB family transcriptional regulator [Rhodobacteraceae bacterium]|nr:AbrB family transcriptional regulator [Paracoccaceae bacterium]
MSRGGPPLANWPPFARWALLLTITTAIALPLTLAGLPASVMLSAIFAGICVQMSGGALRLPRPLSASAEALLGCLMAGAITPGAVSTFAAHAPLFLAVVAIIIGGSTLVGWQLYRLHLLPGTTAIWGLSPGAAPAMMLMAGAFGGDTQLVAFMQYLRVVIVALVALAVSQIWAPVQTLAAIAPPVGFDPRGLAEGLAVAAVGLAVAQRVRLPAGTMLVPLVLGGALHASGLVDITLPAALLAAVYALIGWAVGLNFTLPVLRHAIRVLPQVMLAILSLIALSGLLAAGLTRLGIDPLTAYLATSPGGMSSVAVIAATSKVDIAFVISLQMVRFLLVVALGPVISRRMARQVSQRPPAG